MKLRVALLIWNLGCVSVQAQTTDICKQIQQAFPIPSIPSLEADFSKPFNFNEHSVSPGIRKALESICFHFEKNGEIRGPDNRPLSKAQYYALMDPFNAQTYPLTTEIKGYLYSIPCRFDSGPTITCRGSSEDIQYTLNNL